MNAFRMTHVIEVRWKTGRRELFRVMLTTDGNAYTRAEWTARTWPDWQQVDGEWRFRGNLPSCSYCNVTPFTTKGERS